MEKSTNIFTKIISGGQTGADLGGLLAGRELGIPTGGTAPKGFRTESGAAPWLRDFGLAEDASMAYTRRTTRNVMDASGTVIFGNISSIGSAVTLRLCNNAGKPVLVIPWPHPHDRTREDEIERFRLWCVQHSITVLNVAGNRESRNLGIWRAVRRFLVEAYMGKASQGE